MMHPTPPSKSIPSPRSSPRTSPKNGVRLFVSKSNSFKSLLLGLIAFSSITNVLFWRQKVGAGLDNKRFNGQWDAIPQEKEPDPVHVKTERRQSRQYSRTRQTNDSHDMRRDSRISQQQLLQEVHHSTKSTVVSSAEVLAELTPIPNSDALKFDNRDIGESSIVKSGNDELNNETEYHISGGHQRPSFRPHPIKKEGQFLSLPKPTESIKLHRLVFLDGSAKNSVGDIRVDQNDLLTNNTDEDGGASEDGNAAQRSQTVVWDDDEQCVPMSEWQTTIHPSCNSLHELDLASLINDDALSLVSSKGYWRNAWKVDLKTYKENDILGFSTPWSRLDSSSTKDMKAVTSHVVLKSLKYIHEPNNEVFELNRVDAISLDVLTKSHFTVNIYGYCGHSSIQEFAGGDLKSLLPKLDPIDKLRVATWLANGVADIHSVDSVNTLVKIGEVNDIAEEDISKESTDGVDSSNISTNVTATPVSLIHNDINMDNILLGYRNGVEVPLINDFNIAVFRKKDARTGLPCLFHGRFANPQWMSPEQQSRPEDELSTGKLNEKIDIYALGNILYKIAVGNSPWKYDYQVKKITDYEKGKIARAKLRGAKPKVPPEIRNSTSPIKAILSAMNKCYRNNAALRPSAKEIANYLQSELDAIELPLKVMDRFEFQNR